MTSVSQHVTAMYATKRRRRNSKNVRAVCTKDSHTKSNPSKRHRERLNQELDTLASLLPFEQSVLSKLDKLSILRLSVSYLRTKSYFQAALASSRLGGQLSSAYHQNIGAGNNNNNNNNPNLNQQQQQSIEANYPPELRLDGDLIVQALNGFLLILTCDGEVFYTSHTVETYLGFHQSDICHQSVYELVHSEDREELMQQLRWNSLIPSGHQHKQPTHQLNVQHHHHHQSSPAPVVGGNHQHQHQQLQMQMHQKSAAQMSLQEILASAEHRHLLERNFTVRFRCLLDNTSGFLRLDIRGRIKVLHGQQNLHNLSNSAALAANNGAKRAGHHQNQQQHQHQQQLEASKLSQREPQLAFFGVCIPFGPPSLLELPSKDSVFKSKHRLDLSIISMDARGRQLLGLADLTQRALQANGNARSSNASSASEQHHHHHETGNSKKTSAPALSSSLAADQLAASDTTGSGGAAKTHSNGATNTTTATTKSTEPQGGQQQQQQQSNKCKQHSLSAYDLVHQDDLSYMASAHQELLKTGASGLIAYRMIVSEPTSGPNQDNDHGDHGDDARHERQATGPNKYQWLQTSAKLYYKNSKPDFILCTHRPLMEEEGRDLLGKRTMDFKVTYLDIGLSAINDRILACDKFSSLQALSSHQHQQPASQNCNNNNNTTGSPAAKATNGQTTGGLPAGGSPALLLSRSSSAGQSSSASSHTSSASSGASSLSPSRSSSSAGSVSPAAATAALTSDPSARRPYSKKAKLISYTSSYPISHPDTNYFNGYASAQMDNTTSAYYDTTTATTTPTPTANTAGGYKMRHASSIAQVGESYYHNLDSAAAPVTQATPVGKTKAGKQSQQQQQQGRQASKSGPKSKLAAAEKQSEPQLASAQEAPLGQLQQQQHEQQFYQTAHAHSQHHYATSSGATLGEPTANSELHQPANSQVAMAAALSAASYPASIQAAAAYAAAASLGHHPRPVAAAAVVGHEQASLTHHHQQQQQQQHQHHQLGNSQQQQQQSSSSAAAAAYNIASPVAFQAASQQQHQHHGQYPQYHHHHPTGQSAAPYAGAYHHHHHHLDPHHAHYHLQHHLDASGQQAYGQQQQHHSQQQQQQHHQHQAYATGSLQPFASQHQHQQQSQSQQQSHLHPHQQNNSNSNNDSQQQQQQQQQHNHSHGQQQQQAQAQGYAHHNHYLPAATAEHLLQHYSQSAAAARSAAALASAGWPTQEAAYQHPQAWPVAAAAAAAGAGAAVQAGDSTTATTTATSKSRDLDLAYGATTPSGEHQYQQQSQYQSAKGARYQQQQQQRGQVSKGPASLASDGGGSSGSTMHRSPLSSGDGSNGAQLSAASLTEASSYYALGADQQQHQHAAYANSYHQAYVQQQQQQQYGDVQQVASYHHNQYHGHHQQQQQQVGSGVDQAAYFQVAAATSPHPSASATAAAAIAAAKLYGQTAANANELATTQATAYDTNTYYASYGPQFQLVDPASGGHQHQRLIEYQMVEVPAAAGHEYSQQQQQQPLHGDAIDKQAAGQPSPQPREDKTTTTIGSTDETTTTTNAATGDDAAISKPLEAADGRDPLAQLISSTIGDIMLDVAPSARGAGADNQVGSS